MIQIKEVDITDIINLKTIARNTFDETFSESNTEEDMNKYLDEAYSNERLTMELTNPDSHFYFAMYDNVLAGYLKLNKGQAQTELKDSAALEIERIYVLKQFQGAKIGQALYAKAIEFAKTVNVKYIWLGVWEENVKAIGFYTKNGFVEFDKHLFKLGTDVQTDIMMKLEL